MMPSLTWLRIRYPFLWRLLPSPLLPLPAVLFTTAGHWWPLPIIQPLEDWTFGDLTNVETISGALAIDGILRYGLLLLALSPCSIQALVPTLAAALWRPLC